MNKKVNGRNTKMIIKKEEGKEKFGNKGQRKKEGKE